MEGGEWEGQAGKGIISVSNAEIKKKTPHSNPDSIHPLPALQLPTYENHCGEVWFFFFEEAKEYSSHAVAPLTSYKWSKLHRCMKIVLCKVSTSLFRYTLGQCCYSLFQTFPCPELSYFNVSCFIFFRYTRVTFSNFTLQLS